MSKRHETFDTIGQALGTRYVAAGSVRSAAHTLLATACLCDGATGERLWQSSFQTGGDRSHDAEDDLAIEVATGLAVAIDAQERLQLDRTDHEDDNDTKSKTVPLILKADHLTKLFRREANQQARALAERACRIDPSSARAHVVLSRSHHLDVRYGWSSDPDASAEKALDLASYATELDPMDASGYAELGLNKHFLRDHDAALACYRRALDINPNDPDILAEFGDLLISNGAAEQAIEPLGMAIHLRPERGAMYRYYLAGAFDVLGDDETAIGLFSSMSDDHEAHRLLAACHARLGMEREAARHVDIALKRHPDFTLAHWRKALPHRDADVRERLIEGMESAGFR